MGLIPLHELPMPICPDAFMVLPASMFIWGRAADRGFAFG
jgi:hypothetical protein